MNKGFKHCNQKDTMIDKRGDTMVMYLSENRPGADLGGGFPGFRKPPPFAKLNLKEVCRYF